MIKQDVADTITVTVSHEYHGETRLPSPELVEIAITESLASAFGRAADLNTADPFQLSFTSLLVGMIAGDDDFSRWLKAELERFGATARKIAGGRFPVPVGAHPASNMPPPTLAATKSAYEAIAEGRAIASAARSGA